MVPSAIGVPWVGLVARSCCDICNERIADAVSAGRFILDHVQRVQLAVRVGRTRHAVGKREESRAMRNVGRGVDVSQKLHLVCAFAWVRSWLRASLC